MFKRYIFRIFNYKIKYKIVGPVQFEKSINKGLNKGLRQKRNPFWEREGKKVEAYSKGWSHSSSSYSSIQNVKE